MMCAQLQAGPRQFTSCLSLFHKDCTSMDSNELPPSSWATPSTGFTHGRCQSVFPDWMKSANPIQWTQRQGPDWLHLHQKWELHLVSCVEVVPLYACWMKYCGGPTSEQEHQPEQLSPCCTNDQTSKWRWPGQRIIHPHKDTKCQLNCCI